MREKIHEQEISSSPHKNSKHGPLQFNHLSHIRDPGVVNYFCAIHFIKWRFTQFRQMLRITLLLCKGTVSDHCKRLRKQ